MTSISQLTEEERNFTRFFLLNFKVSPDIVRRFFDGVFPPAHLAQTVNSSMHVITNLTKTKRINAAQLEILRGVPGTVWPSNLPPMPQTKATCSKDFDLTMMIFLLRNLGGLVPPTNGWDQLPQPNEILPGADLATLKWYRNQLAHTTVTCMDSNEFTDNWNRVEKALTSLNQSQRPNEITEILSYDLDGVQAKILANAELKQLKKEYLECEKEKEQLESDFSSYKEGNLPKNIAEANETLVETWIKDDESFHETVGSKLVYDKVKNCSCVVVTSNSGLGKTATVRHIALKFKLNGYEIVPIESPEDIIKYTTKKKQLFLVDDVLGKYDLSPTLLDEWERKNEKLISCLDTGLGSKKIVCTLRLQITLHKRFNNTLTILNKVVINLEHESCALSKEEKQNILMKHLRRNNLENEIETEEVEKMCKTIYAFPLLCKLVSNNEERFRKKIPFFRQPFSLLKEELDKISNVNKKLYCVLVLCMLFNGSFSRSLFDIDSHKFDDKINKIMQTCRLEKNMSKKELEDSALSAVGSYFTKDSYNFRFIHDALEETVSCHFCTLNPKEMFTDCNIWFIRDRLRVYSNENINENVGENIVCIREDELNEDRFIPLYTRLWTELKSGRFSTLLMSHLFKNRNFVRIFGTYFEKKRSILGSKNPFFKTSSEYRQTIDQSFIRKILKILSNNQFQNRDAISRVIQAPPLRSTIMHWIVAFGCYEFFRYAWSTMTPSEHKWFLCINLAGKRLSFSKPFFPLAVLGGSLDIVKELICTGADVNCFSECGETPLYIAVKSGRCDMARLLLRNGAHVNLRERFDMKIPILVTSNKHQLTSLILEYDLNQTEFHNAVRYNDLHKLSSNIPSEYIDSTTKSGWTILHYAVLSNNVEAVKVLFNDELPRNEDSSVKFIQDDQRGLLCRKPTPTVSIVDNNGLTAVHLAVINNNTEILSVLLRNKAEVKVRDDFDRTPLHYATSERATKLLLTHSSQDQCLATIRNANEMREYEKAPISVFSTTCFNITLKTAFRNVCRDYVNLPDSAGNTPLHSVLNRCLLKKESSDCIETLLEKGANPYLLNDMSFSALELIDSCCDTETIINNSAEYTKSLGKTCYVFAFVFIAFAFGLLITAFYILSNDSENVFHCVEEVTESDNITLVQQKRSLYVILLIIVPFWLLLLIRFDMSCSYHRRFFIFVLLMGCGFLLSIGAFVYQVYHAFRAITMFAMLAFVIFCNLLIVTKYFLTFVISKLLNDRNRENISFLNLYFLCIFYMFMITFVVIILNAPDRLISHDTNTLNITTSNCTEFSSVNISCTRLAYTITYKNGVDFSVQCHPDPNITSYNGTHGTLTVESQYIDCSEIVSILLLWLHLICTCCVIKIIFISSYFQRVIKKQFRRAFTNNINSTILKKFFFLFETINYYAYLALIFFIVNIIRS